MEKNRRVACRRCRSKHLKCNGAWPCSRCRDLSQQCRYETDRHFIPWREERFRANQVWIRSPAKRFCFDPSVPAPKASTHAEGDAVDEDGDEDWVSSIGSPRASTDVVDDENDQTVPDRSMTPHVTGDEDTGATWTDLGSSHIPVAPDAQQPRHIIGRQPSSSNRDSTNDNEDLAAWSAAGSVHGQVEPPVGWERSAVDGTPDHVRDIAEADGHIFKLSNALLHYFDRPWMTSDTGPVGMATVKQSPASSTPASTIPPGACRAFPLQDFTEAHLFKYWIDEVAPWFDIADPNRYFELVVPIITRAKPPLLCAIFALAAQHLLSASPAPGSQRRPRYQDQLHARLSKLTVMGFVLDCLPAVRAYHATPDDDDRESLFTAVVLLRQVELLDRDRNPRDRCLQSPPGTASPDPAAYTDTFLPVLNAILRSPEFPPLMKQSGLVQAAYMLALRQELYYSLSSRQPPRIALAGRAPSYPFAYEMTVNMLDVLGTCWGGRGASLEVLTALLRRQDDLETDNLLGIRPIFHQAAEESRGLRVPTIWYASKTEMYLIQMSKMARAMLGHAISEAEMGMRGGSDVGGPAEDAPCLVMDVYAIALGRAESPHGMFHADVMGRLLEGSWRPGLGAMFLQQTTRRLAGLKIWPFKHVVEMHWG